MNVAVSRAKDLFIVFAAANRWNNGDTFQLMSRWATNCSSVDFGRTDDAPNTPTAFAQPGGDEPAQSVKNAATLGVSISPERQGADEGVTSQDAADHTTSVHDQPVKDDAPPLPAATLSGVLANWRERGEILPAAKSFNAKELNPRLKKIGLLEGEPGNWSPSQLAATLGLMDEEFTTATGESAHRLVYSPRLQSLLFELYREGKLDKPESD